MLRCTTRRLSAVRPAVISTIESRKRVRSRVRGTRVAPECPGKTCGEGSDAGSTGILANELVAHAMYGAEVYWTGRITLQFLAKLQNVIVPGAGGGIILVSPHLVQQFVTADHAVRILHQELQGFEFLRGENHDLAVALHFHFLEVNGNAVETYQIHTCRSRCVPQRRTHAGQKFPGAEGLGYIIVGAQLQQ